MNRRAFLSLGGGVAAATLLSSLGQPAAAAAGLQTKGTSSNRTLLVVDLQGGNDALNTFVPATGAYHDVRASLGLSDDDLLTFAGLDYGVHPGLASLEALWAGGQMTAIYGTGLQGQGRSHFVAQDAWRTARPGVPARSGWLGRWLETNPVEDVPLRAIALGQSTLAAQGEQGRPVAIQSVDGFRLRPPQGDRDVVEAMLAMAVDLDDGLTGLAQAALPATVDAVTQLQELVAGIGTGEQDQNNDLDNDRALFTAAQAIIQGNVGTQVLYVTINGFDTHALQAPKQDVLLTLVADGLSDLFTALDESGHAEDTLALVVSEFGRRVAENGSAGTDHGKGGLSFLLGPSVIESTVVGEPDLSDLDDGDLRITVDAREMYDSALRWLGASDGEVVEVLGGEWNEFDLVAV